MVVFKSYSIRSICWSKLPRAAPTRATIGFSMDFDASYEGYVQPMLFVEELASHGERQILSPKEISREKLDEAMLDWDAHSSDEDSALSDEDFYGDGLSKGWAMVMQDLRRLAAIAKAAIPSASSPPHLAKLGGGGFFSMDSGGTDVDIMLEGMQLSPSKRRGLQVTDETDTSALLLSPSKRHRGKQEAKLVLRRSPKLCQNLDCVFSRSRPGEPARAANSTYCVWCDAGLMKSAIESEDILKNLRVSLSIFQKSCPNVYQRALALLPADAGVDRFAHYCKNRACVFSRKNPGTPGLVHGRSYCSWCDADELAAAQATKDGRRHLNHSLNIFKKVRPDIYDVAFAKLASEFPRGAKSCHASGCVYSQIFQSKLCSILLPRGAVALI